MGWESLNNHEMIVIDSPNSYLYFRSKLHEPVIFVLWSAPIEPREGYKIRDLIGLRLFERSGGKNEQDG